jgi:hypothetical protein
MQTTPASYDPVASNDRSITAVAVNAEAPAPLCWGAVVAGSVIALSIHLLLTLFLTGLGVQAADPLTEPEPGQTLGMGVGIIWSLSALVALFLGGWVAGRLTPEPSRSLGKLHGVLVWSVATVAMALFFTTSAGMVVGGAAKLLGRGVTAAGEGAAGVMQSDFVGNLAEANSDVLGGFVRELLPEEGGPDAGANAPSPQAVREVSWALVRYFGEEADSRSPAAAAQLAQAIARNTGVSEAEALDRVNQLTAAYEQIQNDLAMLRERAEREAREAAEAASDHVTRVAVWTFLAFAVGAMAAALGGGRGARARRKHDVIPAIPAAETR